MNESNKREEPEAKETSLRSSKREPPESEAHEDNESDADFPFPGDGLQIEV